MKTCGTCKLSKSVLEYDCDKQSKDGLRYECRSCGKIRGRAWYERHKARKPVNSVGERVCEGCGEVLSSDRVRQRAARFCSESCRRKAYIAKNSASSGLGLTTATVGSLSELLVGIDLLKRGYDVFRALSPSCSCDLIAVKDGNSLRIEVRSGFMSTPTTRPGKLCYGRKPNDEGKQDVFAVAVSCKDVVYLPEDIIR